MNNYIKDDKSYIKKRLTLKNHLASLGLLHAFQTLTNQRKK